MSSSKQKTPKSAKKTSGKVESPTNINVESVVVSPGRSPTKGNLTGMARCVKDGVADWHNSIDKWDVYNGRGLNVINQIANIKLQTVYGKENEGEMESDEASSESEQLQLEALCEKLLGILSSMEKLLKKMTEVTSSFQGIVELEKHQNQGCLHPDPLFLTWSVSKFHENSEELLSMYQTETRLKRTLAENVAHTCDRNTLMFYCTAWQHQPYIDNSAKFLLESMLHETGHK